MDAAERKEILSRYVDHTRRFDQVAARRRNGNGEVIPFNGPLQQLEQEPTMHAIEPRSISRSTPWRTSLPP